jgi:hypothetical protein
MHWRWRMRFGRRRFTNVERVRVPTGLEFGGSATRRCRVSSGTKKQARFSKSLSNRMQPLRRPVSYPRLIQSDWGARAIDVLHVHVPILESEVFLATDAHQSRLAKPAGLKAVFLQPGLRSATANLGQTSG